MVLVGNMLGILPEKLPCRIAWMKNVPKLFRSLPWKHVPYRIVWIFSIETCRAELLDFFHENMPRVLLRFLSGKLRC